MLRALAIVTVFLLPFADVRADDAANVKLVVRAHLNLCEISNPRAYSGYWTDDGVLTRGRTAEPDEHDVVMERSKIDEFWRLSMVKGPVGPKAVFADFDVNVDGEEAQVEVTSTFVDGDETEIERMRFLLRKIESKWRIYAQRMWPLEWRHPDKTVSFNEETYPQLDAEADAALQKANDPRLVQAGGEPLQRATVAAIVPQVTANRWRQAHAMIKKVSEETNLARHWKLRGDIALRAGDPSDAQSAFEKAFALDPSMEVPDAVRYKSR